MSRLLFAAARGARVQRLMQCPHRWENYQLVAPLRASDVDRIHPDDEHLQYGPISTALRRNAEDPPRITDGLWPVEKNYLNVYKYSDEMYVWADDLHKSLMLLLVAEALADEGL